MTKIKDVTPLRGPKKPATPFWMKIPKFKPDPLVSRCTTTVGLPDGDREDLELRVVYELTGKGVEYHPEHGGETLVIGYIIDRRTGLDRTEELHDRVYTYMREDERCRM